MRKTEMKVKKQHRDSNVRVEFESDEGLYTVDALYDPGSSTDPIASTDILAVYLGTEEVDFPDDHSDKIHEMIAAAYEDENIDEELDECLGTPSDFDELQDFDAIREDLRQFSRLKGD
jgi:hypothetical protein